MRTVSYVAICLLTGCLARPHLDKQSFMFALPSTSAPKAAAGGRILGLRTLQVAEPFEGPSFVYRTGEFSYDRDPYAEFIVHPAQGLFLPISSGLRETGGFSAVVETGSALKPNTLVEIHVVQLYGDFRPAEHPTAVLAIRFVFFDSPNGAPGKVILEREYSRAIPLKAQTAVALIEGWNQALAQILDAVVLDLGRIDANAPKP
jgi:cholesterol transport system auxiliary component